MVNFWLDDDLYALVEAARRAEGQDRSRFVRDAIVEHLRNRGYVLAPSAAAPARDREEIKALPLREDPDRVAARAAVQRRLGKGDSKISAA